jgi:hypothetical protein
VERINLLKNNAQKIASHVTQKRNVKTTREIGSFALFAFNIDEFSFFFHFRSGKHIFSNSISIYLQKYVHTHKHTYAEDPL